MNIPNIPGIPKDILEAQKIFQTKMDKITEKQKMYVDKIQKIVEEKKEIANKYKDNSEEYINEKLLIADEKIAVILKLMEGWINEQKKKAMEWLMEQKKKAEAKKDALEKLALASLDAFADKAAQKIVDKLNDN